MKKFLGLSAPLFFFALVSCARDDNGSCLTRGAVRIAGICDCPEGSRYDRHADACIAPDASTADTAASDASDRKPSARGGSDAGERADGGMARIDSSAAPEDGEAESARACTTDGAVRCPVAGSELRQRCEGGAWLDIEPCAAGEVCDGSASEESSRCRPQSEACAGSGGRAVCDGVVMTFCNASGVVERTVSCVSQRQCELGLPSGACAACSPATFRCEGLSLEKCSDDGAAWTSIEQCSASEPCNAKAGACTREACTADSKSCDGDVLQRCNADRTAFEEEQRCEPGLCDDQGEQCDVCVPGTKSCEGNRVKTCDQDGQGTTTESCPAEKSICSGSGKCVQCTQPNDCPAPKECTIATCNVAAGTCGTMFKSAGTPCSAGVCDGKGSCGPAPRCGDGEVNQRTEECDDGNLVQEDDCRNDCKRASCGDGFFNRFGSPSTREECDVSAVGMSGWGCTPTCKLTSFYTTCLIDGDCGPDQICLAKGLCTKPCTNQGAFGEASGCPAVPSPTIQLCEPNFTPHCVVTGCRTDRDCPPGATCFTYHDGDERIYRSVCLRRE